MIIQENNFSHHDAIFKFPNFDVLILSQIKVERIKKTGTFEELVALHRLIQDVHVKIDGLAATDDCIPERYGRRGNPVFKVEGPAFKNSGMDLVKRKMP